MPFLAKKRKILPYSRARSTKTRIETLLPDNRRRLTSWIREQDPLKQGLKHINYGNYYFSMPNIREQDPLKQGLKPTSCSRSYIFTSDSRARSTKTRIETYSKSRPGWQCYLFASKIH